MAARPLISVALLVVAEATDYEGEGNAELFSMTCGEMKQIYKDEECCGNPGQVSNYVTIPKPHHRAGVNPCDGMKGITEGDDSLGIQDPGVNGFNNVNCYRDAVAIAGEQSGADVTAGYQGGMESDIIPVTVPYINTNMCPVNVHWHLGAEHRSEGQYDETGTGPGLSGTPDDGEHRRRLEEGKEPLRRLEGEVRYGYACALYDGEDERFEDNYVWQHCLDMHVGETYEVHWPHSALGACGTPNQYQTPFYDGVFCNADVALLNAVTSQMIADHVGVQGQVFTIINDEDYYYPDLIRGMIVDQEHQMGVDVAVYSGSSTGTTRDNAVCSAYTPITWQVDRQCHLISASTFDKMCSDMKQQRDDMSPDLHAHGARDLVDTALAANNQRDQSSAGYNPVGDGSR